MIVVFGSINVDLVARVTRFPRPGETLTGETFAVLPGGKGANQALAARRAGAVVAMVGAVGPDAFAETALATLVAAGVDVSRVRRTDGATGVALIQVDALGENCITVVPGANADVDPTAVPDAMLGPDTTLVMQLELPLLAVRALTLRARARHARIVLNAAPARSLPKEVLGALDVLVVNEVEAAAVAAGTDVDTMAESFASAIHRRYGCAAVVTLGAQGALAVADGQVLRLPAPAVRVVDTTGAGDAFTGALAAALDRKSAWPRALAEGVAAGSLACAAGGAQAALPSAAAIRELAAAVESSLVSRPLGLNHHALPLPLQAAPDRHCIRVHASSVSARNRLHRHLVVRTRRGRLGCELRAKRGFHLCHVLRLRPGPGNATHLVRRQPEPAMRAARSVAACTRLRAPDSAFPGIRRSTRLPPLASRPSPRRRRPPERLPTTSTRRT